MESVEGLLQFSIYLCTNFGFGIVVHKASLTPILFIEVPVPSQYCQQSFQIMCYVYRLCHLILELFPLCGIFVIFHFITIFVIYIEILRLSHISPRVINI